MSNKLSIRCPSCNVRLKAPVQLIGETRNCPGCGHSILVRDPSMAETKSDLLDLEDSGVILVGDDEDPRRSAKLHSGVRGRSRH